MADIEKAREMPSEKSMEKARAGDDHALSEPLCLRDYIALVAFREIIKHYNSNDWARFCVGRAFDVADGFVAASAIRATGKESKR